MKLKRITQLTLCLVALAAAPLMAQEATPASEADRALLNEAAANLAAADSYQIDLNADILVGEAGSATTPIPTMGLTGTIAVDARAEMAEGEFTITNAVDGATTARFILSGDTFYWQQTPARQWWAIALDELMDSSSTSDADTVNLAAVLSNLNIAPYSALWRLPDEDGHVRLRTSFDLRSFLTDPQIGNLVSALVSEEMESEIGMTREEIISLLPLLSFILQEAQLESGYQIAPDSAELMELSVGMDMQMNAAMLSSDSEWLELEMSLVATFSGHNETSVDSSPPANAEFRTLEELLQSMAAVIE